MDRKQLLGAVFDEIEHHFKLYDRERKVYLGLAIVAGLSLLSALLILWLRPASHSAGVAVLGASGLMAFAATRSTLFFHSVSGLAEEVVKRFSKTSEPEIVSSVEKMKKRSEASLFLLACAAAAVIGSVVYSFARARQMEQTVVAANDQVARTEVEVSRWQKSFNTAQQAYATLKESVMAVYPAHILSTNQVVGVRAGVQKAVRPRGAPPGYAFTMALSAAPAALVQLRRVGFSLRVPGQDPRILGTGDAGTGFQANYEDTDCVPHLDVTLELADGSTDGFVFDQCRMLGMPEPTAPTNISVSTAQQTRALATPVPARHQTGIQYRDRSASAPDQGQEAVPARPGSADDPEPSQ